MNLGEIPPVLIEPSKIPSEETKKELADYTPSQRNIQLYERMIVDLTKMRDEFRQRITVLEEDISQHRSHAVAHEALKGRHVEATTQHFVTTLLSGFGALGMGIFSKPTCPAFFWSSVTLTATGIFFGLAVKPLSWVVRWWHCRK